MSAQLNLVSAFTAPIPTPQPLPTAPSTYPQKIPARLVKKILDLEFVEMLELVPDSWRSEEADCCSTHSSHSPRRGPVTNILLWLECYPSLVAVLASRYPTKVAHFMTYVSKTHNQSTSYVCLLERDGLCTTRVSEEKLSTPKTLTGVKWTQTSTIRPLSEELKCSSNVPPAPANCTLQLNVISLRLPTQHHKLDHQDGTLGKENRFQSVCCIMTGRETDGIAHMPQTASAATPVQPAKDDIPT